MKGTGLVKAIGLMSGTSLDGVDAAEVMTDGETIDAFGSSSISQLFKRRTRSAARCVGPLAGQRIGTSFGVVQDAHIGGTERVRSRLDWISWPNPRA